MKLVAMVLLAGSWGCWGSPPPAKPIPVTAGSATPSVTDLVRVISPGATPRKQLRYQLRPNSTERIELDMAMTTATHMNDTMMGPIDNKAEIPTMRSRMKVDIGTIGTDRVAALGFLYEDCRIAPEAKVADPMRTMLDGMLGKFVGMRGTAKLTARGTTQDLKFEPPDNADPMVTKSLDQMKDQMKNFYVALPDEPVGIGAEWEISQINSLMGASITTVMHYKLTAIAGNTVTCDVSISQAASNQPIDVNGMAGTLTKLESAGRGRIRFLLDRLTPVGTLAMDTSSEFSVRQDGAETVASTTIHVDIATRPVK